MGARNDGSVDGYTGSHPRTGVRETDSLFWSRNRFDDFLHHRRGLFVPDAATRLPALAISGYLVVFSRRTCARSLGLDSSKKSVCRGPDRGDFGISARIPAIGFSV